MNSDTPPETPLSKRMIMSPSQETHLAALLECLLIRMRASDRMQSYLFNLTERNQSARDEMHIQQSNLQKKCDRLLDDFMNSAENERTSQVNINVQVPEVKSNSTIIPLSIAKRVRNTIIFIVGVGIGIFLAIRELTEILK